MIRKFLVEPQPHPWPLSCEERGKKVRSSVDQLFRKEVKSD